MKHLLLLALLVVSCRPAPPPVVVVTDPCAEVARHLDDACRDRVARDCRVVTAKHGRLDAVCMAAADCGSVMSCSVFVPIDGDRL